MKKILISIVFLFLGFSCNKDNIIDSPLDSDYNLNTRSNEVNCLGERDFTIPTGIYKNYLQSTDPAYGYSEEEKLKAYLELSNWVEGQQGNINDCCMMKKTCEGKLKMLSHLYYIQSQLQELGSDISVKGDFCGTTIYDDFSNVLTVELDETSLEMEVGDRDTLKAETVWGSILCSGIIEWSVEPAGVVTVNDGAIEAIGEGSTTIYAGLPYIDFTGEPAYIYGACTVSVGQPKTKVDIVFLCQSDDYTSDFMGFPYYGCPEDYCLDYPCYYTSRQSLGFGRIDWLNPFQQYPGAVGVDNPDVMLISRNREGPFSPTLDIVWSRDSRGVWLTEKFYTKPVGVGTAKLSACLTFLQDGPCDPLTYYFRVIDSPREVAASQEMVMENYGIRDLGSWLPNRLDGYFNDFQFGFTTYASHPDYAECDFCIQEPGNPHIPITLYKDWAPLTSNKLEISASLNNVELHCGDNTYYTPYYNLHRAITETPWRPDSKRVVILFFESLPYTEEEPYLFTELISGVNTDMLIEAALAKDVTLYIMTTYYWYWVGPVICNMTESTEGKCYRWWDVRNEAGSIEPIEYVFDDIFKDIWLSMGK